MTSTEVWFVLGLCLATGTAESIVFPDDAQLRSSAISSSGIGNEYQYTDPRPSTFDSNYEGPQYLGHLVPHGHVDIEGPGISNSQSMAQANSVHLPSHHPFGSNGASSAASSSAASSSGGGSSAAAAAAAASAGGSSASASASASSSKIDGFYPFGPNPYYFRSRTARSHRGGEASLK